MATLSKDEWEGVRKELRDFSHPDAGRLEIPCQKSEAAILEAVGFFKTRRREMCDQQGRGRRRQSHVLRGNDSVTIMLRC